MAARPTYVPNRRPGDEHIFEELARRDYEALYKLQEGDSVLDVGAHAGFFATYAADKIGPTGVVFAFEPEADNYVQLSANAQPYGDRIVPMKWALWDTAAELPLSLSHSSAEHSLMYKRTGGEIQMVKAAPLDDIFATKLPIRFMKIDVEGAELKVLRGALQTILLHRPHIAIELDRTAIVHVSAFLMGIGYVVDLRHNEGVFLYGTPS